MNYDRILANIAKHISLDSQETDHFISLLQYKQLSRKEQLLKEGQVCKYLSFVHAGAFRAYHVNKEGKESTIMFAIKDWWITDMYCFVNALPAMVCIEAIEDSEVFMLSKQNMDELFVKVPKFEKFFRILMQNAYIREQLRVLQNLSLTAAERYEQFLQKYPHITEQVTQKQIASYLGVTPEFLSSIRKNKTKGIS